MSFLGEIKRRKVFQVAAVYAVVAWLLIQIVATVEAPLNLPDWMDTFVIVCLAIGFPIALVMSWAFNLTSDGLIRDRGSVPQSGGRTIEFLLIGLIVAAVGWLIFRVEFDPSGGRAERDVLPNSVAVLPFENLSLDPQDAFFAAGIHDTILNELAKIGDLHVIARTSVLQYADGLTSVRQIAEELNVETVLEGTVQYAEGQVRITAQLIDPGTGAHLWSGNYDRDFAGIFEIQSEIASRIARALEAELIPGERAAIEAVPTTSLEAYELYLAAGELIRESPVRALELTDRAIALDPEFALAWSRKGAIHSNLAVGTPSNRAVEEEDARLAIQRAIELQPTLAQAHGQLALLRTRQRELVDAELAYRRAEELWTTPIADGHSILLLMAGKFEQAQAIVERNRLHDPQNDLSRAFLIVTLGLQGETERALEEYARGKVLYEDWPLGDWYVTLSELGAGHYASGDEIPVTGMIDDYMKAAFGEPSRALQELQRVYRDEAVTSQDFQRIALWAAYFGDPALAIDAMRSVLDFTVQNAFYFWYPQMQEVRQLPLFKEMIREIGLVDYWNEFGWPDICRPIAGNDFACS